MSSASDLRLRLLYSIGQRLESGLEYEDTLQQILTQLAHELNLTRAAISIYDRLGERLRVETTYPPDEGHPIPAMQDQIQDRALEGQTIVIPVLGRARKRGIDEAKVETKPNGGASPTNGHAVTTGLRDDTPVDPRPPEEISAVEAALMRGSCICTPVRHGLEVIGTLYIQKDRIEVYELADYSALMRAVSFMIAQHVRLWQRATESRDIAEQEHAQKQREAEESFAQVGMVGTSGAMKEVFAQVLQVAPTGTTVLVRGESGTGKELVAKAIHYNSDRRNGPFVRVNCGALSESLLESELFGHVKGAFTGAVRDRVGRFEQAKGGTIFLDEIGDFSPQVQVKLLRVLQEREFERVGGSKTIELDIRIVAATHKDLERMIDDGTFREDLFYRFNVFSVHLPPLVERRTDIVLLADYFVEKYARQMNKVVKRISTPAIDMLMRYHWPGNVRELQNVIERAVLLTTDGVVHGHHLPPSLQTAEATATEMSGSLEQSVGTYERELIVEALKRERGNVAAAARDLGMTYRKLSYRVVAHNINPKLYRQ